MDKYLSVITTVLVLTQVIRLIQNTIQLMKLKENHKHNEEVVEAWKEINLKLSEIIEILEEE